MMMNDLKPKWIWSFRLF